MSNQPGSFLPAFQDIEALDGLAAGTFHQVVDGTHDDQAAGAPVQSPGKVQIIGVGNVLGVRQVVFGQ